MSMLFSIRLFTWPWRIVTCNDTICVVDAQDFDEGNIEKGRVVALDYIGQIQWIRNKGLKGGSYLATGYFSYLVKYYFDAEPYILLSTCTSIFKKK